MESHLRVAMKMRHTLEAMMLDYECLQKQIIEEPKKTLLLKQKEVELQLQKLNLQEFWTSVKLSPGYKHLIEGISPCFLE